MKDKATFHSSLALFLTSATGVFTRSLKTSESLPKKVNKREVWKGDTDRQDTGESQCQSQDWNWKTLKLLWRNRKTLPLTVRVLHSTDLSAMSSSSLAFIFSTSMAKSSGQADLTGTREPNPIFERTYTECVNSLVSRFLWKYLMRFSSWLAAQQL